MPAPVRRIERETEGVRPQCFHPLQIRFQRPHRPYDRIINQINDVIVRQVRLPERPLVGSEIVFSMPGRRIRDHQRCKLVRLAGLQVAVRRQDDVTQGVQRLQIP